MQHFIHISNSLFSYSFRSLSVYNVYNAHLSCETRSVSPGETFSLSTHTSLVLGDFNIPHHLADPLRTLRNQDLMLSTPYFDTAAQDGYILLNLTGSPTRLSPTPNQRDRVIDLAFANTALAPFNSSWSNSLPATGSDHTAICTYLANPATRHAAPSPKWKETPWDLITCKEP